MVGLTDRKTTNSPLETNVKVLVTNSEPLPDATLYRQLVDSLIYLIVSQPDIFYVVHLLSLFMSVPRSTRYVAIICILRYVKGTSFYGFNFSSHSSPELHTYSNVDCASDSTYCYSTIGCYFLLGTSIIFWLS